MKHGEHAVTARDLMRRELATLSPDDTIESAFALFEEAGIGGAPVVAGGRLVGMLTTTDLSRSEHLRDGRIQTEGDYVLAEPAGEEQTDELDLEETFRKEDYSPAVTGPELVRHWMSEGAHTVAPDASLRAVCEAMVAHQIHRICVTEGTKLVGLITSFDVVRHIAHGPSKPSGARKAPSDPDAVRRPARRRATR
jgi:CBS domain-containing protein